MPRSQSSADPHRSVTRQPTPIAQSAADLAGRRCASIPSSAAAVTSAAPAPTVEDVTLSRGAASGHEDLEAEWLRLWDAAPDSVRFAFARFVNRLAMPRPIAYDNLLPGVERRVEALDALYDRLISLPSGGGK